jgi:hypothetical protein
LYPLRYQAHLILPDGHNQQFLRAPSGIYKVRDSRIYVVPPYTAEPPICNVDAQFLDCSVFIEPRKVAVAERFSVTFVIDLEKDHS